MSGPLDNNPLDTILIFDQTAYVDLAVNTGSCILSFGKKLVIGLHAPLDMNWICFPLCFLDVKSQPYDDNVLNLVL